jgi:predicted alpha-1,6-mannanase (GH76 family)
MYEWVLATLDASSGGDEPGTGLFWDKVRGDGTIDRALWSYNQGSMVGLNVLLARSDAGRRAEYLRRAATIARRSLEHYAGAYDRQPAAFNAIFFRNLLLLHAAIDDDDLRREIVRAIKDYVDRAWEEWRDRRDRFHLPDGGVTLLNQSAMVQLLALLAWDPEEYARIA